MIEPLESRIAPATVVSTTVLTYEDVDGDDVTVKFTKPILDPLNPAAAAAFLFFDTGGIDNNPNAPKQQLQLIQFNTPAYDGLAGLGISIVAARSPDQGGDGLVNVGAIRAEISLSSVTVDGDLGGISAGVPAGVPSLVVLKSLTVQSMGEFGVSTQMSVDPILSGNIRGTLSTLLVKGDMRGVVFIAAGNIGKATIGGSIIGSAENDSGVLGADQIKTLTVGGDLVPGAGTLSGRIEVGTYSAVTIKGTIYGGSTANSGVLDFGNSPNGVIKVLGDVRGGSGTDTGQLFGTSAKSISIDGSLLGGGGEESGNIQVGSVGAIKVGRDVIGAGGIKSGRIAVSSADGVQSVNLGGSLTGGSVADSGTISSAGDIGLLKVIGDLRSGAGARSGSVASGEGIGTLTVNGSLIGTAASKLFVFAVGDTALPSDVAIGKISVLGRVEFAQILAGYDSLGAPAYAHAQIGAVTIGRDWIASDLVASVEAGAGGNFGDANDVANVNSLGRIASILIKGQALGTVAGGDNYGFVAAQIGSFKVGATAFALTAGTDDSAAVSRFFAVGATGDLRLHEVAV